MIVCFDTETTGVGEFDELLQVTVVDDNEQILLETYLKPPHLTVWKEAEKVNHINYDMVKDAPGPLSIREKLQDIFDRAEKVIGYNTMFDVGFVERCCNVSIDRKKIVDCLKDFREECKKKNILIPRHKLGDAVDYYCPEAKQDYLNNAHDASCDAIATMRVYLAMQDPDKERHTPKIPELSENAMNVLGLLKKRSPEITDAQMDQVIQENNLTDIDIPKVRDKINHFLKQDCTLEESVNKAIEALHEEYDKRAEQVMEENHYMEEFL